MKDKPNDNHLEVAFSDEATGPDILLDAVHKTELSIESMPAIVRWLGYNPYREPKN